MAYHSGDRDQAVRWMEFVKEIGALGNHKLFTLPAFDCEPITDILPSTQLQDMDRIVGGEWNKGVSARSAAAPNAAFRTFAWYFYTQKLGPWAFCEPDSVVLKASAFDDMEKEYLACGKPFYGAHVVIDRIPEHVSGNGIYPQDTPALAPSVLMPARWMPDSAKPNETFELAFDIAGAKEILPQAFFTKTIQHNFRHPGFKSRAEMEAFISPEAVLFHANKDGSLYPFLREKLLGFGQSVPHAVLKYEDGELKRTDAPSVVHQMTMQDHVAALAEYSKRDTFAKARIIRSMVSYGLLISKPKRKRKK